MRWRHGGRRSRQAESARRLAPRRLCFGYVPDRLVLGHVFSRRNVPPAPAVSQRHPSSPAQARRVMAHQLDTRASASGLGVEKGPLPDWHAGQARRAPSPPALSHGRTRLGSIVSAAGRRSGDCVGDLAVISGRPACCTSGRPANLVDERSRCVSRAWRRVDVLERHRLPALHPARPAVPLDRLALSPLRCSHQLKHRRSVRPWAARRGKTRGSAASSPATGSSGCSAGAG